MSAFLITTVVSRWRRLIACHSASGACLDNKDCVSSSSKRVRSKQSMQLRYRSMAALEDTLGFQKESCLKQPCGQAGSSSNRPSSSNWWNQTSDLHFLALYATPAYACSREGLEGRGTYFNPFSNNSISSGWSCLEDRLKTAGKEKEGGGGGRGRGKRQGGGGGGGTEGKRGRRKAEGPGGSGGGSVGRGPRVVRRTGDDRGRRKLSGHLGW